MKRSLYHIFFFLVFTVILFIIPNNIYGQENNAESKDKMERGATVKREIQYKDTEGYNSPQFFERNEKKPRPAWIEALHEARLRGDEKLMRELEAQHTPLLKMTGENVGESVTESSGTVGFPGEPKLEGNSSGYLQEWGTDIHVRSSNTDFRESHPAMATSSDGTIYIVWENFGQSGYNGYLQIYYSTDGGSNWDSYGYISNASYDLSQPSLAIGEGVENLLILAWVVDDTTPHIEVGYTPLIDVGYSLTQVTPPYLTSWEYYEKPVIWTDSYDWSGWYPYLTCEGAYDFAAGNVNICFWRSLDYCATFEYATTGGPGVIGQSDSDTWLDPDGTYGTTLNDLFIACFNATDNYLYAIQSTDYGATLTPGSEFAIHLVDPLPSYPVDPDIEAAVSNDNIMLCCTKVTSGDDDIAQCYSTDAGVTWSTFYTLNGATTANEFAAELTANEGGNSWHVTFTDQDHWAYYSTRPQDLSAYWQPTPDVINDIPWATAVYTKKAITSNWATDDPGIAWSDYRDGPGDYDIYYDLNTGPPPLPVINVNPTTLPFGNVTVGNSSMLTFNIENTGTANLDVTNITGDLTQYTVNLTNPTITPGNNQDIEVTFSPTAIQTYNGIISITHNAAGSPSTVTVTGEGVAIPVPVIYVDPTLLPFGNVVVSTSSMMSFNIENTGTANLEVTNITSNLPEFTVNLTSATITPGNNQDIEVTFLPTALQTYNGAITITHNASGSPSAVTVTGEGIPTPVPIFNVDPTTLPFGSVTIGNSSTLSFRIENIGTANLEVTNITSNQPAFTVNMTSATIAPGNDQNVEVTFAPTNEQMYYGLIEITHNASGSPSYVNVTGEGIPAVGIDDELFSQVPTEYKLLQNYPNPFNPSTSIIFGLPEAGDIKITLFSIVGEEITILFSGYKHAGYHRIEFYAQNLPSGIYFYKLQAADFIEIKKMILLR